MPETDARLCKLVKLLTSHATVVVSGTKIADELDISRSEVWRLIQQLREIGVDIEGHPATGYQLKAIPDLLLPGMLLPLLRGTIFSSVSHYYKIGSTNDIAMEFAAEDAPEGSVFLAEQQTAGRGRGAREWHSEQAAGIYCSVILRPELPPSEILVLSLAVALAVYDSVQQVDARVIPDLKWPNDLLLGGKKFCGILAEMNAEITRVRYMVVGIGINVNQSHFPQDLQTSATSLRIETGTEWSRLDLCAALLKSLDREYAQIMQDSGARESILRRFQERSSMARGRQVEVADGRCMFAGITDGLDERGFLKVRTAQRVRTILSGTFKFAEKSKA
jgi:BirA family biotin operon repressor/biotin-[acetyl-CoA-carboxylase] ligase